MPHQTFHLCKTSNLYCLIVSGNNMSQLCVRLVSILNVTWYTRALYYNAVNNQRKKDCLCELTGTQLNIFHLPILCSLSWPHWWMFIYWLLCWKVYLFSTWREVMIWRDSWHTCPVCQSEWQAEQKRRLQRRHCTNWGMGNSTSCSRHTAWQEEDGHQVRQGSSSTSAWQVSNTGTLNDIMDPAFKLCIKEFKSNKHTPVEEAYSITNTPGRWLSVGKTLQIVKFFSYLRQDIGVEIEHELNLHFQYLVANLMQSMSTWSLERRDITRCWVSSLGNALQSLYCSCLNFLLVPGLFCLQQVNACSVF